MKDIYERQDTHQDFDKKSVEPESSVPHRQSGVPCNAQCQCRGKRFHLDVGIDDRWCLGDCRMLEELFVGA